MGQLGHASDDETGLIYMRARYMDPVTGRFESEDPEGHGINWYWYADANPVNCIDENGMWSKKYWDAYVDQLGSWGSSLMQNGMILAITGAVAWYAGDAWKGGQSKQSAKLTGAILFKVGVYTFMAGAILTSGYWYALGIVNEDEYEYDAAMLEAYVQSAIDLMEAADGT